MLFSPPVRQEFGPGFTEKLQSRRPQIRPAFQLSGTVKFFEVCGGATHDVRKGGELGAAHAQAWRSQETLTLPAGLHVGNSAPNIQIGENGGPENGDENENENWRGGDTYQTVKGQALRTVNCKVQTRTRNEGVKGELSPGQERHTCLAAAKEARTTVEKMDFMLRRRAGEDKIAAINCGALGRLHIYINGSKHAPHAPQERCTSFLGSSITIHSTFTECITNYAKWVEPIYWPRTPDRNEGCKHRVRRTP